MIGAAEIGSFDDRSLGIIFQAKIDVTKRPDIGRVKMTSHF